MSIKKCSLFHILCRAQQATTSDTKAVTFEMPQSIFYHHPCQPQMVVLLPFIKCMVVGEPLYEPLPEGVSWVSDYMHRDFHSGNSYGFLCAEQCRCTSTLCNFWDHKQSVFHEAIMPFPLELCIYIDITVKWGIYTSLGKRYPPCTSAFL